MKRSALVLLPFLVALSVAGQEFLHTYKNEVDEQGRKQGLWRGYDVNGNLKYKGTFEDGIPVGEFTYYYPDGKIRAKAMHKGDDKTVYIRYFFEGGKLMAEGKYIEQKKDSTWNYYSSANGKISSKEHYNKGVPVGTWVTYYPETGNIAEEVPYKKGVKHGTWKQYFTDGTLKSEAEYVDGELEGLMTIYHLNGNVEVSGSFKNSLKHGIWIYFDEDGVTTDREEYYEGVLVE